MNVRHIDGTDGVAPGVRATARAVASSPSLWWPALVVARRFAPRGWWRRRPHLPLPDARYWRFRMETAYGDELATVDGHDVAVVLRWAHRASRRHK